MRFRPRCFPLALLCLQLLQTGELLDRHEAHLVYDRIAIDRCVLAVV
jgi:hypothetical protein